MKSLNLLSGFFLIAVLFLFSCKGSDTGFAPGSPANPVAVSPVVISPVAVTLATSNVQSFSATGGVAPYAYSIFSGSGSIALTTGVFTAPGSAGFTTVRVTDAAGQVSDAIVTVNPALQISPVTQSITVNNTQSFLATGGVSPITFSIVSGVGSVDTNTGLYTAPATPGSAVVRATDARGNISDAAVSVFASLGISPATITLAVNNTATFTAGGGGSPYTYSIFTGTGSIDATTGVYTATPVSGSATVRVTDSLGATANAFVTVNPALTISPTSQTVFVNTTITLTGANGVTPYTFSIVTGTGSINPTTGDFTAPASNGTATVRVTDSAGNTVDASLTVTTPLSLSPSSVILAVNNTATFVSVGGTGPFSYSRVSGTGSINVSTGVYTSPATSGAAIVRVTDSLGATADSSITVNSALTISPTSQTTFINSTISFSGSGGVTPYSFSLVSGAGSINISTGLYTAPAANGSAVVHVTDALGNTASATVTVTSPLSLSPATVTLAVNNTTTFAAVGGTGPFTYAIQSGTGTVNASTGVFTAPATSGSAVVRVTDSLGATDTSSVTVNPALTISPTSQTIFVNGTVSFSQAGGVAPYTFSVFSGTGSVNATTGLYTAPAANGSAVVHVTDALGNTASATVTVTSPLSLSPATVTLAVNNTTTFAAVGGTGPFTYAIQSGTGTVNASTGVFTAPATSGSAVVRVTDSLGATDTSSVTVNPALTISPASQTVSVNGTINFSSAGGVSPYTYAVFSGTGTVNSSTGVYTAPATAGSAVVQVTDSLGNVSNSTVTITNGLGITPSAITLAVNNSTTFSGLAGSPPYTFAVIAGTGTINASTGVFTAPATSGSATVRVTDNIGGTATATVTINAALAITPSTKTLAVTNTFTFSATGGVSPYTYSVFSGGGAVNATSGLYTAPVSAGTATVRVTDSRGNISNSTVTINAALTISPASQTVLANSVTSFTAANGVSPYTYSIVTGGGVITAATGSYTAPATNDSVTLQVTDSLGNTADANVIVTTPLGITPATKTLAVNNTFTFSATGGTSPFTFSVVAGTGIVNSTSGLYTAPNASGTATVRVTDSLGQTANASVTINAALAIAPSAQTVLINSVTAFTASAGVSPYSYAIVTGGGSINASTGSYTAPAANGSVTLRVTDSLGNTADASVTITTTLGISPASKTLAVNNTVTFSAAGGTGPFTFSIFAGAGTINSASGLYTAPATAGTATVRVTDSLGATANAAVTINAALAISPATATIASTGSQTFTAAGGVSPYTYSIASGPGTINSSTGVYIGVSAGSVIVRVTDSLANTSDAALTVNGPLAVTPTTAYVVINSDLSITPAGGVAPYSFAVFSGLGVIDPVTGIYTAPASTGTAVVRTTDSATPTAATADTTITIYNALTLSPTTITIAASGTQTFTATGGVGARTFSIYSGSGTINSSTGVYTAPAVAGTDFVQVTDTIGNVVQAQVRVVASLSISPNVLKLPVFSTMTFTSVLGMSPYTYSVFAGTGTINSSTGLYTAPATASTGTARVTDFLTNTSDAAVTHIEPVNISAGATHTCALYNEGSVKCWGLGSSGQLGNGATTNLADTTTTLGGNLPFINLGTGFTATAIATGYYHSCALLNTGAIKCWGQNTYGQLGVGNTTSYGSAANQMGDSLPAVNLGTGKTATKIFAFGYMTCAILNDASTKCWGRNSTYQLGLGDLVNRGTSAAQMGDSLSTVILGAGRTATKLVGGLDFTCALLDNFTVKCWGANRYGQIGNDSTTTTGTTSASMNALPAINLGSSATELAGGYSHACAVLSNGTAKCWGRNVKGQLGIDSNANTWGSAAGDMATLPIVKVTTYTPAFMFGGNQSTCTINSAGGVRCFGLGLSGQLLLGSTVNIGDNNGEVAGLANVNLGTSVTASKLAVGFSHACVITNAKRIKCWGAAASGALGSGQTANNLGDVAGELGDSLPHVNN